MSSVPDDHRIRVLLVDDEGLVRSGFKALLDAEDGIEVVGEAENGAQAVERARASRPDVVLMDIRMPRLDGIQATREIASTPGLQQVRVLILTTYDTDAYVFEGLQAGASGFLLKDAGPAELLAAIRAVHTGDAVVAPGPTRRLLDRFLPVLEAPARPTGVERLDVLTEREREVLEAVGKGLNNAEIAAAFVVAEATVKTHIGRILAKLGLRDRVQMVVLAYETGLVRVGDAG